MKTPGPANNNVRLAFGITLFTYEIVFYESRPIYKSSWNC